MSIRTQYLVGVLVFILLTTVSSVTAVLHLSRLTDLATRMAEEDIGRLEEITHLNLALLSLRRSELERIIVSPEGAPAVDAAHEQSREEMLTSLARYTALVRTDTPPPLWQQTAASLREYLETDAELYTAAEKGLPEARILYEETVPEVQRYIVGFEHLRKYEGQMAEAAQSEAERVFATASSTLSATLGLLLILEFLLAYWLLRSLNQGLSALLAGTEQVAGGNLSHRVVLPGRNELAQLARAFNTMVISLDLSQKDNKRLQKEREEILTSRYKQVVAAQEEERRRVAADLHDHIGQMLTGLQLGLSSLANELRDTKQGEQVADLRQLAVDTMDEVRNMALNLRPGGLDELGLLPAIRALVRDVGRRGSLPIEFSIEGSPEEYPPETAISFYRIIQEALTNVLRHANATQAEVRLQFAERAAYAEISDNGEGFRFEPIRVQRGDTQSLGLKGMFERAELVHGRLEIDSAPGRGTTVRLWLSGS